MTHSYTFRPAAGKVSWALPRGIALSADSAVYGATQPPAFVLPRSRKKAAQCLPALHDLFVASADAGTVDEGRGLPAHKGNYAAGFGISEAASVIAVTCPAADFSAAFLRLYFRL